MLRKLDLPILPGSSDNVLDYLEAKSIAESIGYPIIIKSTNGGGGRGIKVVLKEKELKNNFLLAKKEAELSFGSNQVYIEKYLSNPRHIEIQVLCDNQGNAVHLGERECSIQRRNQKIIEECPSPAISDNERKRICEITIKAMKKIGYFNIGTVEYLYSDGNFFLWK